MDGKLYLGKEYDAESRTVKETLYYYKTSHLTTHAVVFGMTGSGKTGLCIDMLEELIDEGVGIVVVDPKGDVSDLALLFPELSPEEFEPWVPAFEAAQKGMSVKEYAEEVARKWEKGLASWGIGKDRIKALKERSEIRIFTPGSSAGLRVNILQGFKRPALNFEQDEELILEKIKNTVSALLSLLGLDADPFRSKYHIFLSSLIEYFWKAEREINLPELILAVQRPPVKKLGVFDVDSIIEEKERIELAYALNNLLASPTFKLWSQGFPLSAERLYSPSKGKVPVNIFYLAHLSENEKMFFVSLLFNEVLSWIRTQPGSPQLKYLLYMDEIFGYLPPHPANPPSKTPLLMLLKQARAFGLGVVLVTQNPKDVDYKALSNAGTWFIGKLQTEHDRERLMEGLESVALGEERLSQLGRLMASLDKRVFLVNNVHETQPALFYTRWAMAYLAGPLSRQQIKRLVQPGRLPQVETIEKAPETFPQLDRLLPFPPNLPPGISALYEQGGQEKFIYRPHLYIEADVVFDDQRAGLYLRKTYRAALNLSGELDWGKAEFLSQPPEASSQPDERALGFEPLPFKLDYRTISKLQSQFKNHLLAEEAIKIYHNPELRLFSEIDEDEVSFRLRCRQVVERMIDREVEKLREKYEERIQRLEDRLEREREKIAMLETELAALKTEEIISAGETVLSILLGSRSRRGLSAAARKRRMIQAKKARIEMEESRAEQLEEEIARLKEELEDEIAAIEDAYYEKADKIEPYEIKLERNDIIIDHTCLLWRPAQLPPSDTSV